MPDLGRSQQEILHRLKIRGPQSVKILARQLAMTTMGVRQHLAELKQRQLATPSRQTRQTRGRPVHLWKLTQQGHQQFPDNHSLVTVELIDAVREQWGDESMNNLIDTCNRKVRAQYAEAMASSGGDLQSRVQALAKLRNEEGYMAEVRLLPDGWLLIENHCPISAAAERCRQFCRTELELFRDLLGRGARVERTDYLLAGARRCAYKISPQSSAQ